MSDLAARPAPDEEWDNLMRQLRTQPKVQPRPFFYYRVYTRLTAQAAAKAPALPNWLRRPAYAALCGAVVLALAGDCVTLRPAAGGLRGENSRPQLFLR